MANNKLHGYTPKTINEKDGNRLDQFNPHEFRTGMDYELTKLGCSRLAESTLEEREKSTETVLKNLVEYGGYYTSLITYETKFRNTDKKPSFKQWLAEQGEYQMKEINKEYKNDKMVEPKPNDLNTIKMQTLQPLKEAIKNEIKNIISEAKDKEAEKINKADAEADKEPSKKDMKSVSKDSAVTARKDIDDAKKELAKKEKLRSKHFATYQKEKSKAKTDDGEAAAKEKYVTAIETLQKGINKDKADIKKLTASLTDISEDRKKLRREVAKTMMDKDTHMEILKIVKEAGVIMNEGSDSVKMYYEIAKTAYQEGFMTALDKNQE